MFSDEEVLRAANFRVLQETRSISNIRKVDNE